jgi:hypothetical protein
LRKALDGVTTALLDPVWQSEPSPALKSITAYCENVLSVANALVNKDGTPVEWDLSFIPPPDSAPEDKQIINVYRSAGASNGKRISDLSRADAADPSSCELGVWAMNLPLTLEFRKFSNAAQPDETWSRGPDWALCRMIRAGQCERLSDGTRWRFKVPLHIAIDGADKAGNLTFEARLKQPLPDREAWP